MMNIIWFGLLITSMIYLGPLVLFLIFLFLWFGFKEIVNELSNTIFPFWITDEEKYIIKNLHQKSIVFYKNALAIYSEKLDLYNGNIKNFKKEVRKSKRKYTLELEVYEQQKEELSNSFTAVHNRAENHNISLNKDGTYSQRSQLGKETQESIEKIQIEFNNLEKPKFEHVIKPKEPVKPAYKFSMPEEANIPQENWNQFNTLWDEYNVNRQLSRAMLFSIYGWITSFIFLFISIDSLITMFLYSAIVAIVFFVLVYMQYKDKEHNIPKPPIVTLENIDTYSPIDMPLDYCLSFNCYLDDLNNINKE